MASLYFRKGYHMLKRTISYTDYFGRERKEDFYFNLTKSELIEMEISKEEGFEEYLTNIINSKKGSVIMETFKKILFASYGEKSEDGRRFIKSPELSKAFSETEAYNILFQELVLDADKAVEFVNGILPTDISEGIENVENNRTGE